MVTKTRSAKINELNKNSKHILPILDCLERLFICNVIHENKTHRTTVICSSYGPISLLPGCKIKSISPNVGIKPRDNE